MTKRKKFYIPDVPWELIAKQRNIMRRLWNRVFDMDVPVLRIQWNEDDKGNVVRDHSLAIPHELTTKRGTPEVEPPSFSGSKMRVQDQELDVLFQLDIVRREIDYLKASKEVGIPLANTPAFDLVHFGTGPLATAFGSNMVLRENNQPAFEPAVHTPKEVMRLKKPNLFKDGILPQILERIKYYNDVAEGKVILSPCDTAGPWSIATSIWHYEDMMEAIYTAPKAVHYLLDLVTESIIEWYNIQEAYISRWGRTHSSFSWPWLQRGCVIGDDCMVAVSPEKWEEFFLPYNNRLSREYGNMVLYHCCMRYDTHFDSIVKTDGFAGFDATPEYNNFEKIASVLERAQGIWTLPRGPGHMDQIRRLAGNVGMLFEVAEDSRAEAIRKAIDFLGEIRSLNRAITQNHI